MIKKRQKIISKRQNIYVLFCILSSIFCPPHLQAQSSLPSIGNWREHLSYLNTIQIVKGNKIFCATNNNVFSIDSTGTIERDSKTNGLSDVGVSGIGWDDATQQLVIAYTNSNIDVLKESDVTNINDIEKSNISGDKTIYNIFCNNGFAYLCSGLGIIKVDLTKYEISDNWIIGSNGSKVKASGFTADNLNFYAATTEGLKTASVNAANLADYTSWISQTNNGLNVGAISNVLNMNGKIICQKNDSLFVLQNNQWNIFYAEISWHISNISSSDDKLLLCETSANSGSRVLQLNAGGVVEKNLSQQDIISIPKNGLADNNTVWIADSTTGLWNFSSSIKNYSPDGPAGAATGEMIFYNDTLFVAAGGVDANWNPDSSKNGLYVFADDVWSNRNYNNISSLDSVADIITLAADSKSGTIWAGSYGGGLINFNGNQISIYKNNFLQSYNNTNSYRVSGLAVDGNNNLWLSNYGTLQPVKVRKADGTWKSFSVPYSLNDNAVGQMLVDGVNQIWAISPKSNGVLCFNNHNTIDITNDDQWKLFTSGIGNGNLPSNNVLCLAKDENDFIWIGTDNGVAVVQCTENLFTQNCDAVLPIAQTDAIAGYLFQGQSVQCIAVDGADRKWVGTNNGVWLVSEDGTKIVEHFTTDNSPLLNNNVNHITINPTTGEVFFSTQIGICSYRSTATKPETDNSNVLVFPNPVPPNYHGTIAIRGLAENSIVKITEMNGRMVYQTQSLGGQAVWNGLNYKNEKVASGVYLVFIKDMNGAEKLVTKIVMVSGK